MRNSMSDVLTWIFIVEMGLKLLGLGCAGYWADPELGAWNSLDGTLVLLSIAEMLFGAWQARQPGGASSGGGGFTSVLRMLRMLRILRFVRVLKKWKAMQKLILSMARAHPLAQRRTIHGIRALFSLWRVHCALCPPSHCIQSTLLTAGVCTVCAAGPRHPAGEQPAAADGRADVHLRDRRDAGSRPAIELASVRTC
jgi:hypothetical protein